MQLPVENRLRMYLGVAALAVAFLVGLLGGNLPSDSGTVNAAQLPAGANPTSTPCAPSGSWAVVDSPNPSTYNNLLMGVSMLAPNDIWAVGYTTAASAAPGRTLTMHWDGTQWTTVPSPNANALSNFLQSVYAIAPNDVWAVGYYYIPGDPTIYPQTLIMHWEGTQWTIVNSPNASAWNNYLFGVSASGPNDVWAVGYYDPSSSADDSDRNLTLHYDGTQWTVVNSPSVGTRHNELRGVTVVAPNNVWAVGSYSLSGGASTLTMHYDGTQWTVVPSANGTGSFSLLYAVSAADENNVWAVGYNNPNPGGPGNQVKALIIRWNGTVWTLEDNPSPGTSTNFLYGVAATTPQNVWAMGQQNSGSGSRTLTLRWNGSTWEAVPSANAPGANYVTGGDALGDEAWLVGYAGPAGGYRTLTTRYSGTSCTTPTVTVAPTNTVAPTSTTTAPPQPSSTPGGTGTPASTSTAPVATSTATGTPRATTGTSTPTIAASNTPQATPTACTITFSDVPPDNTFYPFVRCLACRGIVNGYPDGTFLPNNPVTRGQLAKIVSQSAGFTEPVFGQTFEDVVPGSTFYDYIERLASRQVMGGYQCGVDPAEPCGPENRPYFRPSAGATRGQLTKIVSNAAGFNDTIPETQYRFTDVEPGSTFWLYVERLLLNRTGVMSGYPCGGPGEPCDSENRPYFRPNNPLTRGQTSKIVANTFLPDCQTPGR